MQQPPSLIRHLKQAVREAFTDYFFLTVVIVFLPLDTLIHIRQISKFGFFAEPPVILSRSVLDAVIITLIAALIRGKRSQP